MQSSSEDEFFDTITSIRDESTHKVSRSVEENLKRRGFEPGKTPHAPRRKSSILRESPVTVRAVSPTTPAIDELLNSDMSRERTTSPSSSSSQKPNKLRRPPKTKVVAEAEIKVNKEADSVPPVANGLVTAAQRDSTESETSLLSGFSESEQSSVTEPASVPSSRRHDSMSSRADSTRSKGKRPEQPPIREDLVIDTSVAPRQRDLDRHLPTTSTSEAASQRYVPDITASQRHVPDIKPPAGFVSVYKEARRHAIGHKPRRSRTLFFNLASLLSCFGKNSTVAYVDEEFLVQERKIDPQTEIRKWAKERAAKREKRAFWKKWLPSRNGSKTSGESIDDWDTYLEKYRRGEIDVTDTPYDPTGRPSHDQMPFFKSPIPPDEDLRQMALDRYGYRENFIAGQVDRFNQIVAYARSYFDTFTALVSLIDEDLQWFKAEAGFGGIENVPILPRDISFCGHTVLQDEPMVILDTHKDWRFVNGPNVTEVGARFYAGAPIVTPEGFNIGTFCIIDMKPRTHFSAADRAKLVEFADIVMKEVETRHRINQQKKASQMELSLVHFQKQARDWREKKRRADSSRASTRSYSTRGGLSSKSSAASLSLRALETPITEIPLDPRGEHNPFDVATSVIAQTLGLSLVYLLRASTKTKTCMLISSFGLPDPPPQFDPSLHLKALRSKHGILYQNPEQDHLGPEDVFPSVSLRSDSPSEQTSSEYVSGMLIPVDKRVERYRRQRTVSKFVMDAARRGEMPDGKRINILTEYGEEHRVEMNAALAPPRPREPTEQVHIQVEDTVGYVLAAFTKNKRKVFGTEDLRYLQQFAGSLTILIHEEAERLANDSYVV